MKRKLISILLIIMMLSVSFITLPVKAKILNEGYDGLFPYELAGKFTNAGVSVDTVYETLEDYLEVHYVGYSELNKNDITELWISCDPYYNMGGIDDPKYSIKDLTGLYDLPNLKSLGLYSIDETTQEALDTLDFSRLNNLENLYIQYVNIDSLDFSKLNSLKELYIDDVDITNLEFGKLTNLTHLGIYYYCENITQIPTKMIDLSKMNNLEYFGYMVNLDESISNKEEIADQIASNIWTPQGYETTYQLDMWGNIAITLIETLEIEISTDKDEYEVGEKVEVTVSWDKALQATEYVLKFDKESLRFVSASIEDDFYDTTYLNDGEIGISWIALDEMDVNEMTFIFDAISDSQGSSVFNIVIMDLITGELDRTFSIYGTTEQAIEIRPTDYIKNTLQIDSTTIDGEEFNLLSGLKLTNYKVTLQDLLDSDSFDDGITAKAYKDDLTEIAAAERLGTGYILKLYKGEELVKELDIIVYGDITSDGEITALDALTLIRARNNKLPEGYELSTIQLAAGQVFTKHQDVHGPSAIDALAIIKHLNGKYEISQNY